ncbi:formylglycine-generating enzyme family protein, partial [Bacteroidota bacterium]
KPENINSEIFTEPAKPTKFENFTEFIPNSSVKFNMIAVPEGIFEIGSPKSEKYRNDDEGPVKKVKVSRFFMSEIEVSWDEYLAFFYQTATEGKSESATSKLDGITGATPPWGAPDQGWGKGKRPAITMTYHAATVYCQWLSKITGKKYRLPTEAEWEYACRGGTKTPYFFEGKPKKYTKERFWNKIFGADTTNISGYISYSMNSNGKTQEPGKIKANPFGLKNMLGNVSEFCSDYYSENIYSTYPANKIIVNPKGPRSGTEHVIRGGSYRSDARYVRSASRDFTKHDDWLVTDPQIPKSIWWYSDSKHVGIRVICEADFIND